MPRRRITVNGKGRKKVPLRKMENDTHREVTFSKRRFGLFKKASELSTFCGCQITTIVFSKSRKVYSFGNPDDESVISKYLVGPVPGGRAQDFLEGRRDDDIRALNAEVSKSDGAINAKKNHVKDVDKMLKACAETMPELYWLFKPVEEFNLEEAKDAFVKWQELTTNVETSQPKMPMIPNLIQGQNDGFAPPNLFNGSGSLPYAGSSGGGIFFGGRDGGISTTYAPPNNEASGSYSNYHGYGIGSSSHSGGSGSGVPPPNYDYYAGSSYGRGVYINAGGSGTGAVPSDYPPQHGYPVGSYGPYNYSNVYGSAQNLDGSGGSFGGDASGSGAPPRDDNPGTPR